MHNPSIKRSKPTLYFSITSRDYYKFPEGQKANHMDICLSGIFFLCVSAQVMAFWDYLYLKALFQQDVNPLKPELNPICYLLALLAHHFPHVSRIRVKSLTFRQLMSYIYGAPILDVSRSHTTTQHSR